VKVDGIDSRLAVIEKDLGGWSIAGEFRFDARFTSNGDTNTWYRDTASYNHNGKNEFDLNRYRMFLRKRIDENTSFTTRIGANPPNNSNNGSQFMYWERYYVTAKLPYDISLTAGRQLFDWEGDLGLHHANEEDALFGDLVPHMLRFEKNWSIANVDLIIGRRADNHTGPSTLSSALAAGTINEQTLGAAMYNLEQFMIMAKAGFHVNERVMLGLMGYAYMTDTEYTINFSDGTKYETDTDLVTYGAYAGFNFSPSIQVKGVYYVQNQGRTLAEFNSNAEKGTSGYDDKATAWKAIIDVKQEALKFTSLWLEYVQMDNNFIAASSITGSNPTYGGWGANILVNRPYNTNTATIMFARADQRWNDKMRTFLRYVTIDHDTRGVDNATNWGLGVGYRLTPAVEFELSYDKIDYGNGYQGAYNNGYDVAARPGVGARNGDDNVIRFRTYVTF